MTNVVSRRGGWWVNKAPAVRRLAVAGVLSTAILFVLAASIDWFGGKQFKEDHPFFGTAASDLFKASLIGTAAVLILDDWRTWGASWRAMRPEIPRLANALNRFHVHLVTAIGLSQYPEWMPHSTGELFSVSASLQKVIEWVGAIYRASSVVIDAEYRIVWYGADPSTVPPHPVASWDNLVSVLGEAQLQVPHTPETFDHAELTAAITSVQASLTSISPSLSVSLQREASDVTMRLGQLVDTLPRVNQGLLHLAGGRALEPEAAAGLDHQFSHRFVNLTLLIGLVAQIDAEAKSGRPVNRRVA